MEGPNDTSGDFLHWLTHWNITRNHDGWASFYSFGDIQAVRSGTLRQGHQ